MVSGAGRETNKNISKYKAIRFSLALTRNENNCEPPAKPQARSAFRNPNGIGDQDESEITNPNHFLGIA
jgi:hypothetical protein